MSLCYPVFECDLFVKFLEYHMQYNSILYKLKIYPFEGSLSIPVDVWI